MGQQKSKTRPGKTLINATGSILNRPINPLTVENFAELVRNENLYFSRLPSELARVVFEIYIRSQPIEFNGFRYDLRARKANRTHLVRFIIGGPLGKYEHSIRVGRSQIYNRLIGTPFLSDQPKAEVGEDVHANETQIQLNTESVSVRDTERSVALVNSMGSTDVGDLFYCDMKGAGHVARSDLAHQLAFRVDSYFVMVFDLSSIESWQLLKYRIVTRWQKEETDPRRTEAGKENLQRIAMILGNKRDLPREVPAEEVRQFCEQFHFLYYEVSAKEDQEGKEIRSAFEAALQKINSTFAK